jgi:hypothetical protein
VAFQEIFVMIILPVSYQQKAAREATQHQREIRPFSRMRWYLYSSQKRMRMERWVTAFYGCKTSWSRILETAKYYDVVEDWKERVRIRNMNMDLKEGQVVKSRQLDERWRKDVLQGVVEKIEGEDVIVRWVDGVTNRVARSRLLPVDIAGAVFVRTYDCDSHRKN